MTKKTYVLDSTGFACKASSAVLRTKHANEALKKAWSERSSHCDQQAGQTMTQEKVRRDRHTEKKVSEEKMKRRSRKRKESIRIKKRERERERERDREKEKER